LKPSPSKPFIDFWIKSSKLTLYKRSSDFDRYFPTSLLNEKVAAIGKVDRAIKQFHDYADVHPELKSSRLFINLQYEIAGTENRLAVERMRYNQAVQDYNQTIQVFPNSLLAKVLQIQNKPFFRRFLSKRLPIK
jgi:LemA protein